MKIPSYPVPVYIGLRLKVRCSRPHDWFNFARAEQVAEVCSVSSCVTGNPIIWYSDIGQGAHWTVEESIRLWTTLDAATQAKLLEHGVISPRECFTDDQLSLCAYRIVPLTFTHAASPSVLESRRLFANEYALPLREPDWAGFERLGYDVVQFRPIRLLDLDGVRQAEYTITIASYGCSPLSCNLLCGNFPVNRYCLFDDIDQAFPVAHQFGREEPEPGPYVIVEVLRRRDPAESTICSPSGG